MHPIDFHGVLHFVIGWRKRQNWTSMLLGGLEGDIQSCFCLCLVPCRPQRRWGERKKQGRARGGWQPQVRQRDLIRSVMGCTWGPAPYQTCSLSQPLASVVLWGPSWLRRSARCSAAFTLSLYTTPTTLVIKLLHLSVLKEPKEGHVITWMLPILTLHEHTDNGVHACACTHTAAPRWGDDGFS